jgi:hypothetical protein
MSSERGRGYFVYNLEETVDMVRKVIAAHPDAQNPLDMGDRCVYNAPDGIRHCIVGQILADLGTPSSIENVSPAGVPEVEAQFEEESITFLSYVQCIADDGSKPWGELPPYIDLLCEIGPEEWMEWSDTDFFVDYKQKLGMSK